MEQSTPIDNTQEINNIISQIEQDNKQVQQEPVIKEAIAPPPPQVEEPIIEEEYEEEEIDVSGWLINEVKLPSLVVSLCILFSFTHIDDFIGNYLSFLWNSELHSLNFIGVFVKSLLFGILFLIISKFL